MLGRLSLVLKIIATNKKGNIKSARDRLFCSNILKSIKQIYSIESNLTIVSISKNFLFER